MVIVDAKEFLSKIGSPIENPTSETLEELLDAKRAIALVDKANLVHIWSDTEYYICDLITNKHVKETSWGVLPSPVNGYDHLRRNYKAVSSIKDVERSFVIPTSFIAYMHQEHVKDMVIGEENRKAGTAVMLGDRYIKPEEKQILVDPFYNTR